MIILPIALTAAGAAALVNFWLSWRIGEIRTAEKISIGDGGNPRLIARMRAQLNFAEYVPLVLILIVFGLSVHALRWDGLTRAAECIRTLSPAMVAVGLALTMLVVDSMRYEGVAPFIYFRF